MEGEEKFVVHYDRLVAWELINDDRSVENEKRVDGEEGVMRKVCSATHVGLQKPICVSGTCLNLSSISSLVVEGTTLMLHLRGRLSFRMLQKASVHTHSQIVFVSRQCKLPNLNTDFLKSTLDENVLQISTTDAYIVTKRLTSPWIPSQFPASLTPSKAPTKLFRFLLYLIEWCELNF